MPLSQLSFPSSVSKLGPIDGAVQFVINGALLLYDCLCLPSMVLVLVSLAPVTDGLGFLRSRLKVDN